MMAPAVILFHGSGPSAAALEWGALAGLGGGAGVVFLYEGFAVGRISSVATTSAVLTAVLPVLVGLALGNHLGAGAAIGIVIAIPAIALVSWQPAASEGEGRGSGTLYGVLSGAGFALLFIALDRAGTRAGAWPLLSCEVSALIPIAPFAFLALRSAGLPSPKVTALSVAAGLLGGGGSILFLAATKSGELAVVAVLAALYPVLTVILARVVLSERWTRMQAVGLATAVVAVVLVTT
jgi:drug/metabolite transporter (DMT)-like permease